jgi:hypothetical protein
MFFFKGGKGFFCCYLLKYSFDSSPSVTTIMCIWFVWWYPTSLWDWFFVFFHSFFFQLLRLYNLKWPIFTFTNSLFFCWHCCWISLVDLFQFLCCPKISIWFHFCHFCVCINNFSLMRLWFYTAQFLLISFFLYGWAFLFLCISYNFVEN